jgi:hypothetical protein
VAELVDALDSKSSAFGRKGSIPFLGTSSGSLQFASCLSFFNPLVRLWLFRKQRFVFQAWHEKGVVFASSFNQIKNENSLVYPFFLFFAF